MGENCDWPCWKIMNCDESKMCLAKIHLETPCWEIAREASDYRHTLDICSDCIVHMLKVDNPILTKKEIKSIMNHRGNCVLA